MTNDTQAPERLWLVSIRTSPPVAAVQTTPCDGVVYVREDIADAQLSEMTRRRDEWRRKAEGYDELAAAVRAGIEEAGDRNLSRVFLRGALVDSERRLRDLEDRVAAQTAAPADASAALDALIAERVREAFIAGYQMSAEGWNGEYPCTDEQQTEVEMRAAEYASASKGGGDA